MSLLRSEQCFWLVVPRPIRRISHQPIRSTTQIWVVTLHQYGISLLVSKTTFRGETNGGITSAVFFLRLHFPSSYCFHHVLKFIGLRWQDWAWNKVILFYFFLLQRSGGFLPTVSANVVLRAYLRLNKRRSNSIQRKSRRSSTVLRNYHHHFSNVLLFRGSQSSETVSSQNCKLTPIFDSNHESIKLY